MQTIRENLINIKPSATLAINELSQKLEKDGRIIYKFGLGQSPFPVPDIMVKELQLNAHKKDYLNVSGLLELRKAVAAYHTKNNKYKYNEENIIIGPGSKELIFQTQLIFDGDLLLPSPSWVSYEPQANILKKNVHWIKTTAKSNWHIEPKVFEEVCNNIKSKTKLLILNSPNNPSGTIHGDLAGIATIAKKYKVIVIADEIYAELDFTGKYRSLTHYYPEGTIIISGISKWCGAGGWRLGLIAFPKELSNLKKALRSVASETFTAVSAPIQYAALKAYTQDHSLYLKQSRLILETIGNYIFQEFSKVGIICQKPQGGFYMICDFSNIVKKNNEVSNASSMCKKILKDTGFAMLPGSVFGISDEKLLTRIAFVDFDGKKALQLSKNKSVLSKDLLYEICPKIIQGVEKLQKWISTKY